MPLRAWECHTGPPVSGSRSGSRLESVRSRVPEVGMATKKRRGPKHPGVVLIKANEARRIPPRARYVDPDSGKTKYETLPAALTTVEAREQWAKRKSVALAKRKLELEGGAVRATGTALSAALDRYFEGHPLLRDRTRKIYRTAADKLAAWGKKHHVTSADDLTRAKLMTFREALIAEPKRAAVANAKRGKYAATEVRRSPVSVNQELRSVRTVLGYLRDLDLFPRLSHDDLRRALKRLPETGERIDFLKPAELQTLLQAAVAHDADTYAETRDEHSGEGRRRIGTTRRYDPIAPFVAFVLLTGCRFEEALTVTWEDVDLDALDHDGRPAGEIHLQGAATKTHKARTIGLEVSPALRTMLATMRPKDGRGPVFGYSRNAVEAAAKRLRADYGAPTFTWQTLRRTCGTFLTNAPGIFGAASAYRSAKQLGHSVAVAERHYLGLVRGISATARTLEDAMGVGMTAGLTGET